MPGDRAGVRLANVLGRTLDELPPQTRRLLALIVVWVNGACAAERIAPGDYRFTRKQVREATGWGNTQLKVHLGRLEDMEYLAVQRAQQGRGLVYALRFDGEVDSTAPHLMGLLDVRVLYDYDGERSGLNEAKSGSAEAKSAQGRGKVGPKSGHGRGEPNAGNPQPPLLAEDTSEIAPQNALLPIHGTHRSRSRNGAPASSLAAALV